MYLYILCTTVLYTGMPAGDAAALRLQTCILFSMRQHLFTRFS